MAGPAFIMLVATVVGGGCNFLYQIIMINTISDELAELNTLLSILYIVTVPSTAVQNVIIRYVSKYHALGQDNVVAWLLKRILVLTSMAGVAIAILLIIVLGMPDVAATLKLTGTLPILLLAIGVVISMVSPVGQGTMQALQRFTPFGSVTVINFALKLTLGAGMVLLGYGVSGALGGVIIGLAFACGASILYVRKYFFMDGTAVESRDIWRFTIPATVALLGYTIITQADVIFATSLLPATEADVYSAASQLAKIILYLPGAVSTVMFPKISKAHAMRSRSEEGNRILKIAFAMTLALSGLVVAVYFLFPDFVVNILIPGNKYKDQIAALLPWLGVAIMFLGLANLFMLYGLATDGHAYIIIVSSSVLVMLSLVGALVAAGVLFTPMMVVAIMFITGLFNILLSGLYLFVIEREWRPRRRVGTP
ncbi:MAG: oligosaccharide flippase family protein [Methanomassiliicoccus sp.]|nr:oligosaccharide flippase family protein [Methanomassiliicoccus sp.]